MAPTPQNYPSQLVVLVGEALEKIGPTLFGATSTSAPIAPRRFVWVPMLSPLDGPKHVGGPIPHVGSAELRFAVECWGHSFDDAWWMVCALQTALRQQLKGRNYKAPTLDPTRQLLTHEGFVLTVQVALLLDMPSVDLDTPPAAPQPSTALDGTPTPDPSTPAYGTTGQTTAQVVAVAEATPATSTSGDNTLEGTET